ncbi:MAG: succinate dehydrogenase assembly factor 2 [Alphaproteobacteria bacterium]
MSAGHLEDTILKIMKLLKKLSHLSWHRGTRENDLLLGRFADACLKDMNDEELSIYETLLAQPDPDIYDWVTKKSVPSPELRPLVDKIRNFYA